MDKIPKETSSKKNASITINAGFASNAPGISSIPTTDKTIPAAMCWARLNTFLAKRAENNCDEVRMAVAVLLCEADGTGSEAVSKIVAQQHGCNEYSFRTHLL